MTRQFLVSFTLFAPFIGFMLALILRRHITVAKWIACCSVISSFVFYVLLVWKTPFGHTLMFDLLVWIKLDAIKIYWGAYIDPLSTLMVGVILIVSCLVHIYSLGYMAHDPDLGRFMSYLNLFTFTMLLLVLSPNLLQLVVVWAGVCLSS
jgi:NADH-quinone oxidoreductase subunit L